VAHEVSVTWIVFGVGADTPFGVSMAVFVEYVPGGNGGMIEPPA
jgi:hypothetical protein